MSIREAGGSSLLEVSDLDQMRRRVEQARHAGQRVGLVPTMGALHEGHMSLVDAAQRECDVTVATIFVNPAQFGPGEDLERYPRTPQQDLARLAERGVAYVFTPDHRAMYPEGFSSFVAPPRVAEPLEGERRPGHFRGVATIVLKLFHIVPADVAYFGQKDYQQTLVVRRMVEDFNLPIRIAVCPIVREPDGLAMSSRNRYLTAEERTRALALSRSLQLARTLIDAGETDCEAVRGAMREVLEGAPVDELEYIALADPETLDALPALRPPLVVAVAARVGQTRLIDNLLIR